MVSQNIPSQMLVSTPNQMLTSQSQQVFIPQQQQFIAPQMLHSEINHRNLMNMSKSTKNSFIQQPSIQPQFIPQYQNLIGPNYYNYYGVN